MTDEEKVDLIDLKVSQLAKFISNSLQDFGNKYTESMATSVAFFLITDLLCMLLKNAPHDQKKLLKKHFFESFDEYI